MTLFTIGWSYSHEALFIRVQVTENTTHHNTSHSIYRHYFTISILLITTEGGPPAILHEVGCPPPDQAADELSCAHH
jgi:hypothetical protein